MTKTTKEQRAELAELLAKTRDIGASSPADDARLDQMAVARLPALLADAERCAEMEHSNATIYEIGAQWRTRAEQAEAERDTRVVMCARYLEEIAAMVAMVASSVALRHLLDVAVKALKIAADPCSRPWMGANAACEALAQIEKESQV